MNKPDTTNRGGYRPTSSDGSTAPLGPPPHQGSSVHAVPPAPTRRAVNLLERNAIYERLENQKIEIERLREALLRIASEQQKPFPTTLDGPMRRDGRISAIVYNALHPQGDAP